MSEVEFNAERIVRKSVDDVGKKISANLSDDIKKEFEKDRASTQKDTTAPSSKPTSKPINEEISKPTKAQKQETKKAKEPDQYDYQKSKVESGAAEAGQVEADLNELKSGRFFGVLTRKAQTIKKTKDWFKDDLIKKGDKGGATPQGVAAGAQIKTASSAMNSGIGSANGKKIPLVRIDKLEVSKLLNKDSTKSMASAGGGGFWGGIKSKFSFGSKESNAITPEVLHPLKSIINPVVPTNGLVTRENPIAQQNKIRLPIVAIDRAIINNLQVKGGLGGGGGLLGGGGGGGGATATTEKIGGALNSAGAATSSGFGGLGVIAGGAMAAAGAAMSAISAIAGMHQSVMQEQDRTIDAVGYVGSGDKYTTNAEMAQIQLSRMKYSNSGWDRHGNTETKAVKQKYTQDVLESESETRDANDRVIGNSATYKVIEKERMVNKTVDKNLDVKFGLSQGIGGAQGAEIFGQLNRFSQGSTDENGKRSIDSSEYKTLITAGVAAGFGGKRQAEFFQGLSGIMKNSVESGFGKLNLEETATSIANLASTGMGSERAMSVFNSAQSAITQEDGQVQNMIIGELMQQGMSYNDAMIQAQKGATKENIETLKKYTENMSPEMQTTVMAKILRIGTFKENKEAEKSGGILNVMGKSLDTNNPVLKKAAEQDLKATEKVGQSYRAVANDINNVVAGMKEVYKLQKDITMEMLKLVKPVAENSDGTLGKIRKGLSEVFNLEKLLGN